MGCGRPLRRMLCSMGTALVLAGCAGTLPGPTATPTPFPPTATFTPVPPTVTPEPTAIATRESTGKLDTGRGGSLTIQGVVRDIFGNPAPNIVHLAVFQEAVFWDITGSKGHHRLGEWYLYTDKTGSYSFNNVPRVEKGHYQVWFAEGLYQYEESGYFIEEVGGVHLLFIGGGNSRTRLAYSHDKDRYVYTLDVTVHPVTNSALCAAIQYKDADGVIKNYLSESLGPVHRMELNRGTSHPDGHEYTISEAFVSDGRQACLHGLAGGRYYLIFQYIRSDGRAVECASPAFEILPGETKQFEYTIQDCPRAT